jgi:hypothetical protein
MHGIRRRVGVRWRPEAWVAVVAVVLTLGGPAPAGVIVGHAAGFDPFYDVYSANAPNGSNVIVAPTVNTTPSFIGTGYDLSGIGWSTVDSTFGVTMISPQYFIGAYHVSVQNNSTEYNQIQFAERLRGGSGQLTGQTVLHTYMLANSYHLSTPPGVQNSDVFLGRLSAPIPASDHIAFYPVPFNPAFFTAYDGQPLVNFGVNGGYGAGNRFHLGTNNVDGGGVQEGTFGGGDLTEIATYNFDPNRTSEFHLISGDSGSPSFIPVNGQLAVLGAHFGVDLTTNLSADSFLPFYVSPLNTIMAADGQSVTLVPLAPVPEPGTFVLVGVAAVTVGSGHWLRRRRPARDAS